MEPRAGGMIRTVDLDVTRYAAATDDSSVAIAGNLSRRQILRSERRDGMVSNAELCVAFLTKKGRRRDE